MHEDRFPGAELRRDFAHPRQKPGKAIEVKSNIEKDRFIEIVKTAKEYIAAGDVYQVVLSQRFEAEITTDPFTVYRALRHVNPSPYMYFLRIGPVSIVGSSPEMLVRVEGGMAQTHPIAGTRPRGKTEEEDVRLGEELKRNEKERSEHVMLVDLGRNDIGRVSEFGTVKVSKFMGLERYSHVMHLVSIVEGKLAEDRDRLDALVACFPAGTVSGAPKVRAMEIIAELEPSRRGIYAGAVGYLDFAGNLDFCITIRTLVIAGPARDGPGGRRHRGRLEPVGGIPGNAGQGARAHPRARAGAGGPVILVIDNYDSFTYNLVQYLGELGTKPLVRRNNEITLDEIAAMAPRQIVISPGPGRPEQAGITLDVIKRFGPSIPLLGVCLGHQAIGMAFGGSVVRAIAPMHGKTSAISHDGRGVFAGIASPFTVARYHSLVVQRDGLPADLEVSAQTEDDGTVMALRHKTYPIHGVQFHPESIMTREGSHLLRNFLNVEAGK